MAKIYKITSRGKTWEQVANNAAEVKQLVAAKFGMKKIPKGTAIVKVGLTKDKPASSPVKKNNPTKAVRVVSKQERFQQRENRKELKGKVLTGPDGSTYTIGQRGRVPLWVREQLGEVQEEVSVPSKPNQNSRYHVDNWMVANKPVTLSAVTYITEENGKVTQGYVSEDCEVVLSKGTKYSIMFNHKD